MRKYIIEVKIILFLCCQMLKQENFILSLVNYKLNII